MYMGLHMQRPEVDVGCYFLSLSFFSLSLNLELGDSARQTGPASSGTGKQGDGYLPVSTSEHLYY